jgi:hypothetical protein
MSLIHALGVADKKILSTQPTCAVYHVDTVVMPTISCHGSTGDWTVNLGIRNVQLRDATASVQVFKALLGESVVSIYGIRLS